MVSRRSLLAARAYFVAFFRLLSVCSYSWVSNLRHSLSKISVCFCLACQTAGVAFREPVGALGVSVVAAFRVGHGAFQ